MKFLIIKKEVKMKFLFIKSKRKVEFANFKLVNSKFYKLKIKKI